MACRAASMQRAATSAVLGAAPGGARRAPRAPSASAVRHLARAAPAGLGATRRVRTALQASPGLQGTPFAARALSSAAEVVLESNTDAALDGVDADAPEGEVMAAAGSAAGSKPPLRPKSHKGLNTVVIDPNDYTAVPFADAGISEELSER